MQGFLSSIPSQGTKIPHATVQKKMCDLWEEVKNVNMNKSLKEVDSNLQEWLRRVQDFRGGSSYRCGGNSKRSRINSGTWRCDWNSTISWYNYNKWGVASYGWVKKVASGDGMYSWWRSYEDCWNDNKRLRILHKLGKIIAEFEKTDSNLERISTVGKCCQTIACHREIVHERKSQLMWKFHFCLILINFESHASLQHPPPWWVSIYQHLGKTFHQQKDYNLLKVQMVNVFFSNKLS